MGIILLTDSMIENKKGRVVVSSESGQAVLTGLEEVRYGRNNLYDPSRLKKWRATRPGHACVFIDNGTEKTANMLAVLDHVGVVSVSGSSTVAVIHAAVGQVSGITLPFLDLTQDIGTWGLGAATGRIYIRTGEAAGRSYLWKREIGDADGRIELIDPAADPEADGVAVGDKYLLEPTPTAFSELPGSTTDIKYYDETYRAFWVRFVTTGFARAAASIIRLGESIYVDHAMEYLSGRTGYRNDFDRAGSGDIIIRPRGYPEQSRLINIPNLLRDDYNSIVAELDAYNHARSVRGTILIPSSHDSSRFFYGVINATNFNDTTDRWTSFSSEMELFPVERD